MPAYSDAPAATGAPSATSKTLHTHSNPAAPATSTAGALGRLRDADDHEEREAALRHLAETLQGADALHRGMVREQAIEALKGKGLSSPAGLVDAALGKSPQPAGETAQGQALAFKDPYPWPEPVDGAELLERMVSTIGRHVRLPDHGDVALALWAVLTHCFDRFHLLPMLALVSPERECGKTTALEVLDSLVARSQPTSSITAAAVYRSVEKYRPTLLIDEADTFLRERPELVGILNCGHNRSGAHVTRSVGDDHEPRRFSAWCPKVIAQIGSLPDTLESRSVLIRMQRLAPGERVEHLRLDRRGHLEELQRQAARWALDHGEALRDAEPEMPEGLCGRRADNWRPLLAIADQALGDWPERARMAALAATVKDPSEEGSHRELLLSDIRTVLDGAEDGRLFSNDLAADLARIESSPWGEWRNGRPLTANGLARLLKPFRIKPKMMRIGHENFRGYQLADFADAWSRYLPPEQPQQPQHANDDGTFRGPGNRNTPGPVAVGESAKPPASTGFVAGVAVGAGESGEDAPAATGTWGEV